jgi:acyl-coenzyme A synthetase/AMP-(fatty) acid ligase
MKSVCLYDTTKLTYDSLLERVNTKKDCIPIFKYTYLSDYIVNLVTCLINDVDIVLIDSDLSSHEVNLLDIKNVDKKRSVVNTIFDNIDTVLAKLVLSKSNITIFTSGTTGQPKSVLHTIDSFKRFVKRTKKHESNVWGFAYNPTHMAGLQVLFQAILNKNTIVNLFCNSREDIYIKISKYQITHISATPTFYRLLLPNTNEYYSIERLTFGGEKSTKALYDSMLKIFPNGKINNVYASTEAGSLFVSKGDIFKISPNIKEKVRIVENELLIHKSLIGNSDTFVIIDGFYCTGDLVEWVDDKFDQFKFVSRKNELINVGGYKVNPYEVEDIIRLISGVENVIVFGKDNSILGKILCCNIKLHKDVLILESDIRKYISERLQDFKVPRRIKFVESLNTTRTGKIKR